MLVVAFITSVWNSSLKVSLQSGGGEPLGFAEEDEVVGDAAFVDTELFNELVSSGPMKIRHKRNPTLLLLLSFDGFDS